LGLRWQDVDLDGATLSITSVLHHLDDGSFVQSRPKTPRSRRQVALLPSSCQLLRVRREVQADEARTVGVDITPETLVLSHPDGSPIRPDSVTQAFSRIAGKTGLSRVRLHDLRHTHATHEDERSPEGGLGASGAFQHQVDDGHLFPRAARYASFRGSWT